MNNRFTLYEMQVTRRRRINRRISILMGVLAAAVCFGLMWATHIPGAP